MKLKENIPRSQAAPETTWNLADLCPSDEVYAERFQFVKSMLPKIEAFRGKLNGDPATVKAYLDLTEQAEQPFETIYVYANLKHHEDMTVSKYQDFTAQVQTLSSQLAAAESFFEAELLECSEQQLEACCNDPMLEHYHLLLQRILRRKKHTLSAPEEAIIAKTFEFSETADDVFSMLTDADMKFGEIEDADGNPVELTQERYSSFMESPDRKVRKAAFERLYEVYGQYRNTISTAYAGNIKKDRFYSDVLHFDSTIQQSLFASEIPMPVYDQLIATVRQQLPAMYRYVSLRKKVLNVDELHLYDVYAPLVPDYQRHFTFEEAKEIVLKALAPMGEDYIRRLKEGFDNRWIDVYENIGKCSGAYSWGAYGSHPYVLLNFQGTLNDVFTLAHEMGHALHSMYSNETQSFTYAGYRIFVAEVASTCNEALLIRYLLSQCTDPRERAYLINYFLDQFRGTLFRQTMFAEFEKTAHQRYADGESLTAEALCDIYKQLNADYFGEEMVIDEQIADEWMRIPHFYNSFYVYQYATGHSAAIALSNRILKGGEAAVADYLQFLRGGCSTDPISLLKIAGVDMTTPQPIQDALSLFSELTAELEQLLCK